MRDKRTARLVYMSLTTALVTLFTAFFKLPVPLTNGYIHLGDGTIFLAALLMGPSALLPAAVGSALADTLFGYYIYIVPTFLIKGCMGLIAGRWAGHHSVRTGRLIVIYCLCEIVMLAGYFVFESLIYGLPAAAGSLLPNLIQGAAGVITGLIFKQAARKIPPLSR